ncbi:vitamin K epoxide reductase family protein [Candidatus Saccharibacteria bacterium]|nr:vitamin K epoxide reductase family protein [Candidatus Saccharibacteria bacterium]
MFRIITDFINHHDKTTRQNRRLFLILLIASIVALLSAFVLSVEAIELIKNPSAQLSCNINSVISCGEVGKSAYSSLFGFPNSFIGMMVEPIFVTVAIAGLFGTKFSRRFMLGMQFAMILAILFALYLFITSVALVGALCPWCLTVDITTAFMAYALTRYNIIEGNLFLSRRLDKKIRGLISKDYDKLLIASVLIIGAMAIILRFGRNLF